MPTVSFFYCVTIIIRFLSKMLVVKWEICGSNIKCYVIAFVYSENITFYSIIKTKLLAYKPFRQYWSRKQDPIWDNKYFMTWAREFGGDDKIEHSQLRIQW